MNFLYIQMHFVQTKLKLTFTSHLSFHFISYHSSAFNYLSYSKLFFYSLRSLNNMTFQISQFNFDYNVDLKSWSQKYVKSAYSLQENIIKHFFNKMITLLKKHNLFLKAFKNELNSCKLLRFKWKKMIKWLQSKFANEIKYIDFSIFEQHLCQRIVIYMSDADKRIQVREKFCKVMKTQDHSTNLWKVFFNAHHTHLHLFIFIMIINIFTLIFIKSLLLWIFYTIINIIISVSFKFLQLWVICKINNIITLFFIKSWTLWIFNLFIST